MSPVNFREWALENSPSWLRTGAGAKVVYLFHVLYDAIADGYRSASEHAIAGRGDADSLSYLASDRRLVRGVFESEVDFAKDVSRAWETSKRAGSTGELARKVCRVFYNGVPLRVTVWRVADTFGAGSKHEVTDPYSEATVVKGGPLQLRWDNNLDNWCRLIISVDMSTFPGGAEAKELDDGHELGDGTTIGTTLTDSQISQLQSETRKALAEHSRVISLHLDYTNNDGGAGATDLQQLFGVNWQGGASWSCMQGSPGSYQQQPIGFAWGGSWLPVEEGSY